MKAKEKLIKLYNEIDAKIEKLPKLCKKGCDRCCHQVNILITFLEYTLIKEFLEKRKIRLDYQCYSLICPLLKDQYCLVYPVRPLICRVYGFAFIYEIYQKQYLTCEKDNDLREEKFPLSFSELWQIVYKLSLKFSPKEPDYIFSWIEKDENYK